MASLIKMKCYAYVDEKGIESNSVGATPEITKEKILREHLGWRYEYSKDKEQEWELLLKYGEIKEIEILIK